jgi:hypothetical protein
MTTTGPAAKTTPTYTQIAARLSRLSPGIKIGDHIASDLKAAESTLEGIGFVPKLDRASKKPTLLKALRDSKDSVGLPAFAEGSKLDRRHWALMLSFGATEGLGFREIWRPRLSNRPLRWSDGRPGLNTPALDAGFNAHFGDNPELPDLSSLHCAITDKYINVHIDQMGFVMETSENNIVVNPDFLRHLLVELGWKTMLRGKIPDWVIDQINPIIPSSPNQYSRVGLSIDLMKRETVKLSVSGSCGLVGQFDCSGTLTLTGTHDVFGGRR